jgi:ribosomal protein L25 (general stress protein Ctc)
MKYRVKKCEERLDAGARSMAEERSEKDKLRKEVADVREEFRAEANRTIRKAQGSMILALIGILGSVAAIAYSYGARNEQVAAMERAVTGLVQQREAGEKERVELQRRIDALASKVEIEATARSSLEELVRVALMPKPRGR